MKLINLLTICLLLLVSCGEETSDNSLSVEDTDTSTVIDTLIYNDTNIVNDTSIAFDTVKVIDTLTYLIETDVEYSERDTLIPYATSASYTYSDRTELYIDAVIPMKDLGSFNVGFYEGGEKDYRIYNNDTMMTVQDKNWAKDPAGFASAVVWGNPEYVFDWIVVDTVPMEQNYRLRTVFDTDTLYFEEDSLFLSAVVDSLRVVKYVRAIRRYENENYLWGRVPGWPNGNADGAWQHFPMLNPLMFKPVNLRISHYFKKVFQQSITDGIKLTLNESMQYGVETSHMNQFSTTVTTSEKKEVDLSGAGKWWKAEAKYSNDVTKAIERTSTHKESISESTTEEFSVELTGREGGTTIFTQWQKVEVFEFVDDQGRKWNAEEFGFNLKTDGPPGIFGFEYHFPKNRFGYFVSDFFPNVKKRLELN